MSHKVATVVTLEVRVPVPAGSNTAQVLEFVRTALSRDAYEGSTTQEGKLRNINANMLVVKLVRKETAYT